MEPIQEGSLGGADNFEAEEQEILAELQKLVSSEVDDEDEKEVTQEEMVSDLESLGLADIARKLTSDVQNDATNSNEENLGVDSFIPEEVAEQEVVKEDKENSLENVLEEAFVDAKSVFDNISEDSSKDVSFEVFETEIKDIASTEEISDNILNCLNPLCLRCFLHFEKNLFSVFSLCNEFKRIIRRCAGRTINNTIHL